MLIEGDPVSRDSPGIDFMSADLVQLTETSQVAQLMPGAVLLSGERSVHGEGWFSWT
jgi:hypothetical protein